MSKRRRVKRFVYDGFGFPVELRNIELKQFRDAWAPDVKLSKLSESAFVALATKPANLTGNEVRFMRQRMRMTLEAFAKHFRVSHQAVMKWERAGDAATGMGWGTEMSVRLALLASWGVTPKPFLEAYQTIASLTLKPIDEVVLVHDPSDQRFASAGYAPGRRSSSNPPTVASPPRSGTRARGRARLPGGSARRGAPRARSGS